MSGPLSFVMGLFLLITTGISTTNARLVGASKCTWGPSYWCSGLRNSAMCHATSHCVNQYWENNAYPEDDDDVCKICKDMVKQARDQLLSNETQEELKEVFEGSCNLIPIKVIAYECKQLADEFIPELVETLASEMNPVTVCSVAGLCNSVRIDELLMEERKKQIDLKASCREICRTQVRQMSTDMRLLSKDDVLNKGLEMCGRLLSSYSDACKLAVLSNFEVAYQYLLNLDDSVCDYAGMCKKELQNALSTTKSVSGDDLPCEFCEKVVQHWIDTWKANSTKEEFKEVLESICKELGQPDRVERCLRIVEDYYIPFFNYILNELDPHTACSVVGLCHSGGFLRTEPQSSITVLLPLDANYEQMRLLNAQTPAPKEFSHPPMVSSMSQTTGSVGGYFMPFAMITNSDECFICKLVMFGLKEHFADAKTVTDVHNEMNKICKFIPAKNKCYSVIDMLSEMYEPVIAELVTRRIDPESVCTHLVCPENSDLHPNLNEMFFESKKKSEKCTLCEYYTEMALKYLRNDNTEEEIQNVILATCRILPRSMELKCQQSVSKYAKEVIDTLVQNLSADEVCESLYACHRDEIKPIKGNKCVVCEYFITTLDGMLEDKNNQKVVKDELDKLCSILPKTVSNECLTFVNTYSAVIIDMITNDFTPDQICEALHLCPSPNAVATIEDNEEELHHTDCTRCENTILDKLNTQNNQDFIFVLSNICYDWRDGVTSQCKRLMDENLQEIVVSVLTQNSTHLCSLLEFCGPSSGEKFHGGNEIPPLEIDEDWEENSSEEDTSIEELEDVIVAELGNVNGPICPMCEWALTIVEKQIFNNRSLDMVERAVEMICSYLPKTVAEDCENFVQNYGDQIIQMLVEMELDPREVCTEMGLCEKNDMWDASPLGGNKCIWGPKMWCASKFHAMSCGTTAFCEQNNWN